MLPIYSIVSLYADSKVKVKVDTQTYEPFTFDRGVRQGDSLSCVLFTIYINDSFDGGSARTVIGR